MIVISPPATPPYAPANQPIAKVVVSRIIVDPLRKAAMVLFQFQDADGAAVSINKKGIAPFDAAAQAAFLGTTAVAGETASKLAERALLPYLKSAYGLTGTLAT